MESNELRSLMQRAEQVFEREAREVEDHLDVSSAALLQLRKACRLLQAAEELHTQGYYTLGVEAAFVSIERTIEFRLLEQEIYESDTLPQNHIDVYESGADIGLYSEEFEMGLIDLWKDYRSKTYYRDGLASAERADCMTDLARELHRHVLGFSQQGYECVCD